MFRSMLAIAAGYFAMAVPNSFIHLIVAIYSRSEVFLTGVTNLPSLTWVVGLTALQFVLGLFGGLLATTLGSDNPQRVILGFVLLMVAVALVDYSVLNEREPLWYLVTAPALKIGGIYTGYKLQINQIQPSTT